MPAGNAAAVVAAVRKGSKERAKEQSSEACRRAMEEAQRRGTDRALARGIWDAWRQYDKAEAGKLDSTMAQQLFTQLVNLGILDFDQGGVEEVFDKYDESKDGIVDFGEFVHMLQDISREKDIPIAALLLRAHLIDKPIPDELQVPKTQIVRWLQNEVEQMDACKQLIPTLLLFVIFLISFILHETPVEVHTQQKGIQFDLNENANFAFGGAPPFETGRMGHKTLYDVNTFADFWSWMDMGLLPLLFHTSWDQNEVESTLGVKRCSSEADLVQEWGLTVNSTESSSAKPSYCRELEALPQTESEQGMYLFYHRVLGGLRLSQEVADVVECDANDGLRAAYGMPCYSSPYRLEPQVPMSFLKDLSKINRAGGETQWFLVPSSLADVRVKIRKLEDRKWAWQATQRIEVAFATYNSIAGTVTVTYIHIFVNRGGHFWKQVVMASVWLDLYHAGAGAWIVDIIWILLTLNILVSESRDVIKHWMREGVVKGTKSYMGIWNFVDWISVIGALVIFICLGIQASMVSDMKADLEMYDYRIPGGFEGGASRASEMMAKIEDAVFHARWTRIIFAFYSFVIGLRFFKVFAAQPRLALVTMTLANAAVDIVHFGLVFLTTICIYAASGLALFGHELQDFSTYERSVGATMRCLLGDIDWAAMEEVGRSLAGAWFWSFQIFVVNIMFNMLIAILIDAYAAVKSQTVSAETLWSQTYEIIRRYKGRVAGTRLSFYHILKVLSHQDKPEAEVHLDVTAQQLCQQVEGMPLHQANRILSNVSGMIEDEKPEVTLEQTLEQLQSVQSQADSIFKGLQVMIDTQNKGSNDSVHLRLDKIESKLDELVRVASKMAAPGVSANL